MSSGLVLATGAALPRLSSALDEPPADDAAPVTLSEEQQRELSAVQEHLFPRRDGVPGARDINALPFLLFVMSRPGFESGTRDFIVEGLQIVRESSSERFGKRFSELSFDQRESLLRYLADRTRWGHNWLSLLLTYITEALLCDPVYGGNPNGIGWQWLGHQAGFPRPPANKTYDRLRLF